MKVVCLNYQNYLGRGDEYVAKLRNMVARNLTVEHDFIVVTEADPICFTKRTGWFHKLSLLEAFDDEVLYLDLDLVITSNIDHLVQFARKDNWRRALYMRDDFSYSVRRPRQGLDDAFLRLLGGPGCCNSSVMLWNRRIDTSKWDEEGRHGDQNVISAELWHAPMRLIGEPLIGLLPNNWIKSYKYHPGEVAPIVVFHGQPKPHEVSDDFVKEHWR